MTAIEPPSSSRPSRWPAWLALLVVLASLLACLNGLIVQSLSAPNHAILFWLDYIEPIARCSVPLIGGLGWLILFVAWIREQHNLGWVLLLVPFLLGGSIVLNFLSSGWILTTASMNGRDYYLINRYENVLSDTNITSLCECPQASLTCQCHPFYSIYNPIVPLSYTLVPVASQDRLDVWLNGKLLYEYGQGHTLFCDPELRSDVIGDCYDGSLPR